MPGRRRSLSTKATDKKPLISPHKKVRESRETLPYGKLVSRGIEVMFALILVKASSRESAIISEPAVSFRGHRNSYKTDKVKHY